MSKFVPGTTSNKTVKEIDALIVAGLKTHYRINAQSVEPAFLVDSESGALILDANGMPSIVGYKVAHAEPAQRKPRADKGKPRKDASASATSTTSKAS